MPRVYNFNAGPSTLPIEVLEQVRDELLDWHGLGASVMEISHRSQDFIEIAARAEADLRELLDIPPNYKVLFLQGGARAQFAMVPMNLLRNRLKASYLNSGIWAKSAIAEAERFCKVNIVASCEDMQFTAIPSQETWNIHPDSAYFHYTDNETVNGIEFPFIPDAKGLPLVSDMSSNILSRPVDISKYGVIYAGAQKNMGLAGLTVVIVRGDLMGEVLPRTPSLWDYKLQAEKDSMLNTPPTFAWYLAGLVFKWVKRQGGVAEMADLNQRKANKLYAFIDENDFYQYVVKSQYRSRMNIVFTLADESRNKAFLQESKSAGLIGLKGHQSVGGMRASLYNAMPEIGVDALLAFMREFARKA